MPQIKIEISKDFLIELHHKQNKQIKEIAKIIGCCPSIVTRKMREYGLKTTRKSPYFKDLSGKKIGRLLVIERANNNFENRAMWLCLCDCGNKHIASGKNLRKKIVKSCGCLLTNYIGSVSGFYYNRLQKACERTKNNLLMSYVEICESFDLQKGVCKLTGDKIFFGTTRLTANLTTASLDRIDSYQHYVKNNVQWIYKDINFIKSNFSLPKFLEICKSITEFKAVFKGDFEINHHNLHTYFVSFVGRNKVKKGREFSITEKDIIRLYEKQHGLCALSGFKIDFCFPFKKRYGCSVSIDRIDNDKDYILDNIQLVHKDINKSRLNFTVEEYKMLCKKVYDWSYKCESF